VLYIFGGVCAELMPDWTPPCISWWTRIRFALAKVGIDSAVLNALALAFPAAVADSAYVYIRTHGDVAMNSDYQRGFWQRLRFAAVARFVRKSHDQTVRVLFRASVLRKRVMITLKSHKVYVGEPFLPDLDPSHELTSIRLIPFASGYRDKDTKKVTLSTQYSRLDAILSVPPEAKNSEEPDPVDPLSSDPAVLELVDAGRRTVDLNDLGIVIARSEVETLMIWDDAIYRAFQDPLDLAL